MTVIEALEAEGYEPQPPDYQFLYDEMVKRNTELLATVKAQREVIGEQTVKLDALTRFHAGAMALKSVAKDWTALAEGLETLERNLQIDG